MTFLEVNFEDLAVILRPIKCPNLHPEMNKLIFKFLIIYIWLTLPSKDISNIKIMKVLLYLP